MSESCDPIAGSLPSWIEVVYVPLPPASLFRCVLRYEPDMTVKEALNQSGLLHVYPETLELPVGVFSKKVTHDTLLLAGDRVEVYRSLTLDPKEKRRKRAKSLSK